MFPPLLFWPKTYPLPLNLLKSWKPVCKCQTRKTTSSTISTGGKNC